MLPSPRFIMAAASRCKAFPMALTRRTVLSRSCGSLAVAMSHVASIFLTVVGLRRLAEVIHILMATAPPFHPSGSRPRAPCPVCSRDKGDKDPRELYSIRGFGKGEYDSAIPECWFVAPPIKLDSKGHEMEALRVKWDSMRCLDIFINLMPSFITCL